MTEEQEMAGDIAGNSQTWSEAGTGSGMRPITVESKSDEENAAWEEWQADILNDEGSDHAEDLSGSKSNSADRTVTDRARKTRSTPKQKIRIATFFNKHTQSQNKLKRPITLEEVIGDVSDSTDEDSEDNTTPERTQQQAQSSARTGNHRKAKKKKKKKK